MKKVKHIDKNTKIVYKKQTHYDGEWCADRHLCI
jgi:hypothetical protein